MTAGDIPDIGPTPPPWCEPDAQPAWDSLTHKGTTILSWTRDIGPDVWIAADDTIVHAELVRSAARIGFCEAPADGLGAGVGWAGSVTAGPRPRPRPPRPGRPGPARWP